MKFIQNIKKIGLRIMAVVLIAFALASTTTLSLNLDNTAHAAQLCPTGDWEALDPKDPETCTYTGAGTVSECPKTGGWLDAGKNDEDKQVCTKKPIKAKEITEELSRIAGLLQGLQHFFNRLIWPVLILIGGLLDNSLLFGNGMELRLREIWIPIRNLVNILFVIILVGVALYNVLGIGEEGGNYSIKKILPKIIVAIIAVNFSFLGIKVFLDAINVMTVSIFAIPNEISEELATVVADQPTDEAQKTIRGLCKSLSQLSTKTFDSVSDDFVRNLTAQHITHAAADSAGLLGLKVASGGHNLEINATSSKEEIEEFAAAAKADHPSKVKQFEDKKKELETGSLCAGKASLTHQGKAFLRRYNSRNAAFAMAMNMGGIVFYPDLHFETTQDIERFFTNSLFAVMLYLIYVTSFIALFIVLLARLIVLWLAVAISPVLTVMLVTPEFKDQLGFGKISDQFFKNAFAPVIIALVMSIGWVMLKAVKGLDTTSTTSPFLIDPTQGIPIAGLSTLQDTLIALGTIGVVWVGVFAAAEGTLAEGATRWIKDNLQQFGSYVGKIPLKHIPAIPISTAGGEDRNYTVNQLATAINRTFVDAEDTKLLDDMNQVRTTQAKDLNDRKIVNNTETFVQWLNSNKGRLTNSEQQRELKRFMDSKSSANLAILNQLKTSQPGLHTALEAFRDSGYKDTKKAKDVERFAGRTGYGTLPEPETGKGAAKQKAQTTAPQKRLAENDTVDGQNLELAFKAAYPDRSEDEVKKQLQSGLENFNANMTDLATELSKDTPEKSNIEASLSNNFTLANGTVRATANDLKAHLTAAQYAKLAQVVDRGEAGIEAALRGGTPPAAGSGTAGGSGAAPGGGTAGGGTPGSTTP